MYDHNMGGNRRAQNLHVNGIICSPDKKASRRQRIQSHTCHRHRASILQGSRLRGDGGDEPKTCKFTSERAQVRLIQKEPSSRPSVRPSRQSLDGMDCAHEGGAAVRAAAHAQPAAAASTSSVIQMARRLPPRRWQN